MEADIISNLALGFSTAVSPINLFYCFIGVLVGTLIGVLPGIGPVAAVAMLLPLTFNLDAVGAIIMLSGIYYGTQYGGSTTAILVNLAPRWRLRRSVRSLPARSARSWLRCSDRPWLKSR